MKVTNFSDETSYEKSQKHNILVSWLHSFRYKYILSAIYSYSKINESRPIKIIEIGCAHAKLFPLLNEKFDIDYTGIDAYEEFVRVAKKRFSQYQNFRIINDFAENQLDQMDKTDILIALETLQHIPEHKVVHIIKKIATLKPKIFICSFPIEVGPSVWLKNIGSLLLRYTRHKEYTWKETFWAGLYNLDKLPPHGTGYKGFDWRWLMQTIRQNMKIVEIKKSPISILPAMFSTSIFIVAEPREDNVEQSSSSIKLHPFTSCYQKNN